MRRIAHLVEAARAAQKFELTSVGGRSALKIVGEAGTQFSFLDEDELIEFQTALASRPKVSMIPGMPACAWDEARGYAEGKDVSRGLNVIIHGKPAELTPDVTATLGATYALNVSSCTADLLRQVAGRMADLYDRTWRDGAKLTVAMMAERLRFESISLVTTDPSTAQIFVNDGGLFAGHQIEAHLNSTGEIDSCSI